MAKKDKKEKDKKSTASKVQDAASGFIGRISARTVGSRSSAAFIRNAAIGGMYEVAAGKVALVHARSPRVKEIAQQMIDDHTTSIHQLESALKMNECSGEGSLPESVDDRRRGMIQNLQGATDNDFDRAYLEQQILAHKETVDLMTGYRDHGSNPQLRSLAASTAPLVERHLRRMKQLREALAG